METNYCFTCEKSFATYGNLNKHFQTNKHSDNDNKKLEYLTEKQKVAGLDKAERYDLEQLKEGR